MSNCWLFSLIRAPMVWNVRKSNGVPATGASTPVGICVESVGVYVLALIMTSWP